MKQMFTSLDNTVSYNYEVNDSCLIDPNMDHIDPGYVKPRIDNFVNLYVPIPNSTALQG